MVSNDEQFPFGRLNPEDEGKTQIAVAADGSNGVVVLQFEEPMRWIGMPPETAEQLAASLTAKAEEVRRRRV